MNEVLVPENIDMMIQSMYPIRSKINTNKSDNKELPVTLKTVDCYFKNNSSNRSMVSNLEKGQKIEISGILKNDEGLGIVLKACNKESM